MPSLPLPRTRQSRTTLKLNVRMPMLLLPSTTQFYTRQSLPRKMPREFALEMHPETRAPPPVLIPSPIFRVTTQLITWERAPTLMIWPALLLDTVQLSTRESEPTLIPRSPQAMIMQVCTTADAPNTIPSRPLFMTLTFSAPLAIASPLLKPLRLHSRTVPLRTQTFEHVTGVTMPLPVPPPRVKPFRSSDTSLLLMMMPFPAPPAKLVVM